MERWFLHALGSLSVPCWLRLVMKKGSSSSSLLVTDLVLMSAKLMWSQYPSCLPGSSETEICL